MNGYCSLDFTLRDILFTINPLREDWSVRFHVLNELQEVVQSIERLRGATVEPFGSFVSNLFTRWGDLDISIEIQNGSYISSAGKKYKQSLLEEVLTALRKKGGYRRLQLIANAKVPILKFESNYNISCDVSINNLSGQMKSKILFWINEIDGRFRDLVLLACFPLHTGRSYNTTIPYLSNRSLSMQIKEWAKTQNINDPKCGTLNSYSLSLLVIFHLQTCVPAILPPLKEIYPGNMTDDLQGVRKDAEERIKETCEVQINNFRSDKSRIINRSSLSELFTSFLAKFSDISSRASSQGISPFTGQWEDVEKSMRWLPRTYALFIEDPFEQPANTARTVSSKQLTRISEACLTSYQLLTSANQDPTSLVSTLVRPHVSKFLARTPVRNQTNNSRASVRSSPQVQHQQMMHSPRVQHQQMMHSPQVQHQQMMHSPRVQHQQVMHSPQVQHQQITYRPRHHQFQNMRNDARQAATSYRPVQSSNGQQAWRPKSDR